jgi:hypothetical protein
MDESKTDASSESLERPGSKVDAILESFGVGLFSSE